MTSSALRLPLLPVSTIHCTFVQRNSQGGDLPRSSELNARLREQSRARIMEAALEVFAGHGYGGASMRMIAERASISPGLIYAYFESKEALLIALLEESMQDVHASFEAASAEPDPSLRIRRLLDASFAIVRERLDFWRLQYGIRMQAAALPALHSAIAGWLDEIHGELTRILRQAGVSDAALEARILFAEIDGVAQHYSLDPGSYPLRRVIDRLARRYRASSR